MFSQSGLNSVELASGNLQTFLANSIIASCIPKQRPRNAILFSLAYLIALILPSIPLLPNPPGTIIPLTSLNISSNEEVEFSKLSESIHLILTFVEYLYPACFKASETDK